ncbi:hypothetical protein GF357_04005 [Candidatus Dojkabacteria bacterium]|nr:hypothetical protein [Candidatus Dojkabacteria bacterium]
MNYLPTIKQGITDNNLPNEVGQLLSAFNNFDLKEHIKKTGIKKSAALISKAARIGEKIDLQEIEKETLQTVQKIQPNIKIKKFPFYFIYAGSGTDAKSFGGTAVVINLGYYAAQLKGAIKTNNKVPKTVRDQILAASIHEGVHVFLNQLGLSWKHSNQDEIWNIIWEDGLATYMEPTHFGPSTDYYSENNFWLVIISKWLDAKEDSKRKKVIYEALKSKVMKKIGQRQIQAAISSLKRGVKPEDIFTDLLFVSNGPAYHIGRFLWERELAKGKSLHELVEEGSSKVTGWIKHIPST